VWCPGKSEPWHSLGLLVVFECCTTVPGFFLKALMLLKVCESLMLPTSLIMLCSVGSGSSRPLRIERIVNIGVAIRRLAASTFVNQMCP
jgi:hypothetical protein